MRCLTESQFSLAIISFLFVMSVHCSSFISLLPPSQRSRKINDVRPSLANDWQRSPPRHGAIAILRQPGCLAGHPPGIASTSPSGFPKEDRLSFISLIEHSWIYINTSQTGGKSLRFVPVYITQREKF